MTEDITAGLEWALAVLGVNQAKTLDAKFWEPRIRALLARVRELQRDVDYLTNAGVIECAIRNKSVSDYMDHWEGRTLKAEAALATAEAKRDALREQVAEREEGAFMAGWIDGNSEVVHGPTWTYSQESQQRDAAFLRWQARQKGTPT